MRHIYLSLIFTLCLAEANLYAQDSSKTQENIVSDTLCYIQSDSAAFLNSSYGNNRLGGNKINFIDSNIVFKVIGQTENLFKVQLSDERYAFVPKEVSKSFERENYEFKPALTSSFSAVNTGKTDEVSLSLSEKKPYIVYETTDPHKITVQIFGTYLNSVWLTHYLDLKSVKNVDLKQTASDIVEMEIALKHDTAWGYDVSYNNNALTIKIKHAPNFSLKGMTIGLDAGHGGSASGAVSRNGDKEKDLNMSMIYMLKKMLESKGAKIVLSRDGDIDVSMQQRKEIFRDNNIDLLISVHCNAGGHVAHGTSTYYKYLPYRPLAENILSNILEIDGINNFGLIGNFNFSLNAPTQYPNVLVETMFLSNESDLAKITEPAFQKRMMGKVVKGLEAYLRHCKKVENKNK